MEFVPEEFKDLNLCKLAVAHNGYALQFVPKKLRTYELCLDALGGLGSNGSALDFVPSEFNRDKQLIMKAVQSKPDVIDRIP